MSVFAIIASMFERIQVWAWSRRIRKHHCRVNNIPRGMQFHQWHKTVGEQVCPFCSDCAAEHGC